MRHSMIAAVVTALLALTMSAEPTLELEPYEFTAGEKTVEAELGVLRVPETRAPEPGERTIALRFVRFPSTSDEPGAPIVYLAGGPGGSGIESARGDRFPVFMAMREFGDVIALDQRGTGRSEPDLGCSEQFMIPFDQPGDRDVAGAAFGKAASACAERLRGEGIDLDAYDTVESAHDLDDLRKALDADRITLWGTSYGTHLALAALKLHPEGIDRLILAGVEGPDSTLKRPADQQRLLEKIAELARRDPAIGKEMPDMLGSIETLLASLEKEPRRVSLTHPMAGIALDVVVGKLDLQYALASMLRGPDSFAAMPDFVARLEDGDWTALALTAGLRRAGPMFPLMGVAMDCASGASKELREQISSEAKNTLLGDAINLPYPEICRGLGVDVLGEDFRAPARAKHPVLLISGSLDGRTPPENARRVAASLPNATHVIVNGAGHGDDLFVGSPKIVEVMRTFMKGKRVRDRAIKSDAKVSFIPIRKVISLSDDELQEYVGRYRVGENDFRVVMRAGNQLWSVRGNGLPYPIRPMGEDIFFLEGTELTARFEREADGEVSGMYLYENVKEVGELAQRVE